MLLRTLLKVSLAGWLALAGVAFAADAAGIVKTLKGAVTLQRGGLLVPVAPGSEVQVGDRVTTAADGAIGITMADDTLLTAGPGSTLVISEFRFDGTTQEGGFVATLIKGTLHMVTGLIAKTQPKNVNVQTRNAVMGVRGTEFIVDARGDAP